MDYGKMAYLKTEDLTRRMDSVEQARVYPYGVTLLTTKSGRNGVFAKRATVASLMMRVRVRATQSQTSFTVLVNGISAFQSTYALSQSEQDVFFMTNANLNAGQNEVNVQCVGGACSLVDVMVFGEGVSAQDVIRMSAGERCLCVWKDGVASIFSTESMQETFSLACLDASVFATKDGRDALVWTDEGGAWLARFEESNVTRIERIDASAERITGCYADGNVAIATVRKGIARCDGALMSTVRDCTGLLSAYGADRPTFVLERSSGAFYFCRALPKVMVGRAV